MQNPEFYYNLKNLAICFESYLKVSKDKTIDRMPLGYIHPGFDIDIYLALALMNYKYHINTAWSCQGNHLKTISRAYILLKSGYEFPETLLNIMEDYNFKLSSTPDYDLQTNEIIPQQVRFLLESCDKQVNLSNIKEIDIANRLFLIAIDKWVDQEILNLKIDETFLKILQTINTKKNKLIFPLTATFFENLIPEQMKS